MHGVDGMMITHQVGIYGWRKRCLYGFILFLLTLIVINLSLTVWIIRVMDFSVGGMGKLRIIDSGLRLSGEAEFLKSVYTKSIRSLPDEALHVESSRNITVHARNYLNEIVNKLHIGDKKVIAYTDQFLIKNLDGKTLFNVSGSGVTFDVDGVTVNGQTSFEKSIETPLLQSPADRDLRIKSVSNTIKINGQFIQLSAPAGSIHLDSFDDIVLMSRRNAIRLDAMKLYLKGLPISKPGDKGQNYADGSQLCICKDTGRLFLDLPDGDCRATKAICS